MSAEGTATPTESGGHVHADGDTGPHAHPGYPFHGHGIATKHTNLAADLGLEGTCRHCGRAIVNEGGCWVDPAATGDDIVWRETCDSHDTFIADHEPEEDS